MRSIILQRGGGGEEDRGWGGESDGMETKETQTFQLGILDDGNMPGPMV